MARRIILRGATAVLAASLVVVTAGFAAQQAAARASLAPRVACTARGAYIVGLQTPARPQPQSGRAAPAVNAYPGIYPVSIGLRGQIILTSYSGCGDATTAGSFSVSRTMLTTVTTRTPKGVSATLVTLSGSFTAPAASSPAAAPMSLHGLAVTSRPGPQLGRACVVGHPCPTAALIVSRTAFSDAKGALQVNVEQQIVTLRFTTPAATGTTSVTLHGYRLARPIVSPDR